VPDPLDTHCKMVVKAITDSQMVPFLGTGVNLCDRPEGLARSRRQSKHLPSGSE
jgi:hypothetical protein